jgi:hypothetical protein
MRSLISRFVLVLLPLVLAIALVNSGCPAPPIDEPTTDAEVKKDAGQNTDTTSTDGTKTEEPKVPDTTEIDDPGKTDTKPDEPVVDKGFCNDPPPGCDKCGPATDPNAKKKLGETCELPAAGQADPCEAGLKCFEARIIDGQFYRPIIQCVKVCNADSECDAAANQTCVGIDQNGTKACVTLKQEGEACEPASLNLCGSNGQIAIDCLVSDTNTSTAGVCTRRCGGQTGETCASLTGKACRKPKPAAVQNYCLDPVLPGPKCLGETCDISSNATNCLSGLRCLDGYCVKNCTITTQDKDCDTTNGETCFQPLGQEGFCQPKPTVTKAGEECTPLKRCDESKGLACISTGETSICVQKCDVAKGEDKNPDCGADELCQKPSDSFGFGICRTKAKFEQSCGATAVCSDKPSACINIGDPLGALCLKLCETSKNKSEDDASNPDCDGGKGQCNKLNNSISSDGKSYDGACFAARPKTAAVGASCAFNKTDGMRSADCVDGARCVFLGGTPHPTCYPDCDPCNSTRKGTDWVHPKCANGTKECIGLTSGGRPAGGICLPDGKPVRNEGEFCDFQNGCKDPDNILCVRFSNAEDASSICARKCDPEKGRSSNPDCPGNGECGALSNGGGVCLPVLKRSRKIGEGCKGPIGTVRYDDCLEKDKDGKQLFCAEPDITGVDGTCQVFCNPINGFKDNPECKAAGLTNHLCVIGDLTQPNKGACLELCSFSNRKDCSQKQCKYGQCREFLLGKRGDCTDATKEKDCTDKGGQCVNKTCLATVCL